MAKRRRREEVTPVEQPDESPERTVEGQGVFVAAPITPILASPGSHPFGTYYQSIQSVAPPAPAPRPRKVFVAYPYVLPKGDYRRPFTELSKAFEVKFEFADERITNKQILEKITEMIMTSRFSLFDITTWNANVALELGIAIGRNVTTTCCLTRATPIIRAGKRSQRTLAVSTGSSTGRTPSSRKV